MVSIGGLSEYAKSGLPTAAKGIVIIFFYFDNLLYVS